MSSPAVLDTLHAPGGGKPVTVIGIGADGCASLSSRAFGAFSRAQVLVGGARQLAFFPDFAGETVTVDRNLGEVIARIGELAAENNVVVLASGDPLLFGIGGLLSDRLGLDTVEIVPQPSSVQWGFARIGMSWQDARVLSFHGRPLRGLVARLRRHRKAALFTDAANRPARLAAHLLRFGDDGWDAWLCEELGGGGERVRALSLPALAEVQDERSPNLVLLARSAPDWRPPPALPQLDEAVFARKMPKKGLITKREVRSVVLGALRLRPDAVVWDVGAASGAVAIEAGLLAPEGTVHAVEVDATCAEQCQANVLAHGADHVEVALGRAPEALAALPDPDAVFVGGSRGSLAAIVEVALERLRPGGRLVVNAITLENVSAAYRALRDRGYEPETTLVQVSRGAPLAHYQRYEALSPIHVFAVTKAERAA